MTVMPDGRVVFGGGFNSVGFFTRHGLTRLETDGSVDLGFSPSVNNFVLTVAAQSDGGVVLAGEFSAVNNVGRKIVARINPDDDRIFRNGFEGS